MRFRVTPNSSTLRRTPALAPETNARRTHSEDTCLKKRLRLSDADLHCPHPDDGLLQLYICCRTLGRRPHDAVAIFCRDGGVAVLVPSPSFLTMLDLTPLTSRMWLRDCPATTGQNGRQIAPGSSFSEVSPAITLPSRCLANASNLATPRHLPRPWKP